MFEFEEAQFRLGWLPGEALPGIAVRMMEAGFDSQPLRELAGMDRPTLRDAAERFEEALTALDRPTLSADEALANMRATALRALADRSVDVAKGLRLMLAVWFAEKCPAELAIFVGLEDEYYDHPQERAAIEADIAEAARSLLSGRVPPRAG